MGDGQERRSTTHGGETAGGAAYLPAGGGDFRQLLRAYLVEKVLSELLYELTNRPAWVRIPLEGILSLPV